MNMYSSAKKQPFGCFLFAAEANFLADRANEFQVKTIGRTDKKDKMRYFCRADHFNNLWRI